MKMLHVRASEEFMKALDEVSWAKRQSMAETIRSAFVQYFKENESDLPKESRDKIKRLLKEASEFRREERD